MADIEHPRARAAALLANKPDLSFGRSLAELAAEREKWLTVCNGRHGFDDETVDALADFVTTIEEAMIATPAATLGDLLIKTRLAAHFVMPQHGHEPAIDGAALRAVLADLERLAKGAG